MTEFFKGAWFIWLGRNTKSIATFQDMVNIKDGDQKDKNLRRAVINTPSWVYSNFGKGKIVLFSSHPEFVNNISLLFEGLEWEGDKYYGRRTIHNSLFYVTSKGPGNINTGIHHPA